MKSKFSGRLEKMNGGIRNMEYGIQNSKWYENIKYKKNVYKIKIKKSCKKEYKIK